MDIFLDTANIGEIKRWLGEELVDGVTTNPTIMSVWKPRTRSRPWPLFNNR